MKQNILPIAAACCAVMLTSCKAKVEVETPSKATFGNPFMPLWEHIPDGEPYVFDDPDNPGRQRVYLYGSHDNLRDAYCGRDQVVWSAPVEDLSQWRCDGLILVVDKDRDGQPFDSAGTADVLFAPDVACVTDSTGHKTYYLFPNDQAGGRNGLIAKSDRPDGPFEVCNWSKDDARRADGVFGFDPAVFVDDDGRVYGYWGFERSFACELDPATMCTPKPGTEIVKDMVSGRNEQSVGPRNERGTARTGDFRFFEASSLRKIKDKYVFIYSRWTADGEFGLPGTNYTLAYAYSDQPLGPWTYGGTIIDGRGRDVNEQGDTIATGVVSGNTHGSICEINGQWYVFYHRQTGLNEFARQAMVAPIDVTVEPGPGGKVMISEGELTSEGFATGGLDPLQSYSAGIACWTTGPRTGEHHWPNKVFYGSYVEAGYGTATNIDAPYAPENNTNRVVNNTDGSIVGYKYFNFTETSGHRNPQLLLQLTPLGLDGTITVMADRPWTSQGGQVLGTIALRADMAQTSAELRAELPALQELSGKHAIFLVFASDTKEQSLCTLERLRFTVGE